MTSNPGTSDRQHAYSGPELPELPEPSHAERVRTLLSQATIGMLSTHSRRHEGYPFGSLMPFVLDSDGGPIFLISNMAVHTQNLKADPRASLFVTQSAGEGDPLGLARATLIGRVTPVGEGDLPAAREKYMAAHTNSRHWVDFCRFWLLSS